MMDKRYFVNFSMVYPESIIITSDKPLTENEIMAAAFKKIEMFWHSNFLDKDSLEIVEIE
jgi:hypothetical protein